MFFLLVVKKTSNNSNGTAADRKTAGVKRRGDADYVSTSTGCHGSVTNGELHTAVCYNVKLFAAVCTCNEIKCFCSMLQRH